MGVVVCTHYLVDKKISDLSEIYIYKLLPVALKEWLVAEPILLNKSERDIFLSLPEPKFLMKQKISLQILMLLSPLLPSKQNLLTPNHTESSNLLV